MSQRAHAVILGAGPSGLAAGYALAKAGAAPLVIERDKVCGGLMRSIHHGAFVVDVGRKELYNRIEKVDALWSEILGDDYRQYDHRGGILFEGQVIDMSPKFRGLRRGMPWSMMLGCAWDFGRAQLFGRPETSETLEEYFYSRRGRRLTRVFAQGFQEKLTGKLWKDVKVPPATSSTASESFLTTLMQLASRLLSSTEVNTFRGLWRHPARGTGQICDALARGIIDHGGQILYQAQLESIRCDESDVSSVTVNVGGARQTIQASHLVSSIPVELLLRFLQGATDSGSARGGGRPSGPPPRTVVLVYLFLNAPPRFPHAWLQVTCPSTRIGRITNYSGFNGEMVPEGQGCICCEYYCFGADPLLERESDSIAKDARDECVRSGLILDASVVDSLVVRLPGADASQNRDNWMSDARMKLMAEVATFKNVYLVNRTETDIATLAGIEAAEAILTGDRGAFDKRLDPARLHIRTESKSFSFDPPVIVQ